jgi:hypothetical protein
MNLDIAILSNDAKAADICRETLRQYVIPVSLHDGLVRYFIHRIRPGSFLNAVLENDMAQSVLRADPGNFLALPRLVRLLHNEVPAPSWGTPEKVTLWIAMR